jgi:hypothetical protein
MEAMRSVDLLRIQSRPCTRLHERRLVVQAGALALQLGIDVAGAVQTDEVVEPIGEGEAARRPDCVRA